MNFMVVGRVFRDFICNLTTKNSTHYIHVCLHSGKYIAMSVYTVAVVLVLLIPSLNLIFYNVDLYFIFLATALVLINTTVLCLVFLPKVNLVLKFISNFKTLTIFIIMYFEFGVNTMLKFLLTCFKTITSKQRTAE